MMNLVEWCMKHWKVTWINTGIAYKTGADTIQMNKALQGQPNLVERILLHEATHSPKEAHTLHDLIHDLKPDLALIKFCITRPSTWLCLIPIRKHAGTWYYDTTLLRVYMIAATIAITINLALS